MYQHVKEFQEYLKNQNAAAAFLRLPENLVLFSQYWPGYGFSFIFIPASGKPAIICPENEEEETALCGLDNVFLVSDVRMEDGDPHKTLVSILQRLAKQYGISPHATIAIEMGEDVMAPSYVANKVKLAGDTTREIVRSSFDTDKFIPVKDAIRELRSIKNESDIQKLHTVNDVLHKALDHFEALLEQPGIREIDVLSETQNYFTKRAVGYNKARNSRIFGQLSTGAEKTSIAYVDCIWSDGRVLERGDLALFEVGACVDGYWADLTRTGCVGGFHDRKKEILGVVSGSFQAGVQAARDGALAGDVDKACRDYIEKAGYGKYFVHPTGHGTGFAHNECYPVLEPGSKEVLRANMVVAIEPGVYIDDIGGIRLEENVLVGKNGGIILGR